MNSKRIERRQKYQFHWRSSLAYRARYKQEARPDRSKRRDKFELAGLRKPIIGRVCPLTFA